MRKIVLLAMAFGTALVGYGESAPPSKAKVRLDLGDEPAPKTPPPRAKPDAPKAGKETAPQSKAVENSATKSDAGKKSDAKDPKKKTDDEIGKIEGMEIARSEDRYLGVQIVGGKFRVTFYNEKKKPVAPDVARAALRWDPKYKLGMERVMLTASGPHALSSEKFIRPPYNFKLTIVLLGDGAGEGEGAEPAGETYVVDFRQ